MRKISILLCFLALLPLKLVSSNYYNFEKDPEYLVLKKTFDEKCIKLLENIETLLGKLSEQDIELEEKISTMLNTLKKNQYVQPDNFKQSKKQLNEQQKKYNEYVKAIKTVIFTIKQSDMNFKEKNKETIKEAEKTNTGDTHRKNLLDKYKEQVLENNFFTQDTVNNQTLKNFLDSYQKNNHNHNNQELSVARKILEGSSQDSNNIESILEKIKSDIEKGYQSLEADFTLISTNVQNNMDNIDQNRITEEQYQQVEKEIVQTKNMLSQILNLPENNNILDFIEILTSKSNNLQEKYTSKTIVEKDLEDTKVYIVKLNNQYMPTFNEFKEKEKIKKEERKKQKKNQSDNVHIVPGDIPAITQKNATEIYIELVLQDRIKDIGNIIDQKIVDGIIGDTQNKLYSKQKKLAYYLQSSFCTADERNLFVRYFYLNQESHSLYKELFENITNQDEKDAIEKQCNPITINDLDNINMLNFDTNDQYFIDVLNTCRDLDTIIEDQKLSFQKKLKKYKHYLETAENDFCKNLRFFIFDPTANNALKLLHQNKCLCNNESQCNHKKTYTIISHCIMNYASLPRDGAQNYVRALGVIFHPDRNENTKELARTLLDSNNVMFQKFNNIRNEYGIDSKDRIGSIALYNIIKHRSDYLSEKINFKSTIKHLLLPCLITIKKEGICNMKDLEMALFQTFLTMPKESSSIVKNLIEDYTKNSHVKEEILTMLNNFQEKITHLPYENTKQFEIWNTNENSHKQSRIERLNISPVEVESVQKRIHFAWNYNLLKTNTQKLPDSIENFLRDDLSADPIEATEKEHSTRWWSKVKNLLWQLTKNRVLPIIWPHVQKWAVKNIIPTIFGNLQDSEEEKMKKQKKQSEEYNDHFKELFYGQYADSRTADQFFKEKELKEIIKKETIKTGYYYNNPAHFMNV
jgi:hypothetical protein